MEVGRLENGGGAAAQRLHLVDQLGDAIDFIGDQPGQRAVFFGQLAAQQLRRAANTGQRVLDFMRQHFGRAQQGVVKPAGIFAHGIGRAGIMQGQHLPARRIDDRGDGNIQPPGAHANDRDVDLPRRDRRFAVTQPLGEARFGKAQRIQQGTPQQTPQALAEELLGGGIGGGDGLPRFQQQDGQRQAGQLPLGVGNQAHAACRCNGGSASSGM